MKKSKVKNRGGIGIVAKPLLGHKPLAHTKRYTKYLARWTKQEEREHMAIAKRGFTARQWETIKMLLSCGLKFPEACEIAKNCDDEPAWL